jgi:hypothetical protein
MLVVSQDFDALCTVKTTVFQFFFLLYESYNVIMPRAAESKYFTT